ncbi:GNAT family N-acetyltransferase [Puniceibacterium sediminis]|uniref:Acetyltransferase (GNAT) domain-containing protein n=1 Tax=Puniceibacterium sediminis TaxID=1608407 RepID=A0A238WT15_9RHOB|nr:GNAT family N-acetyltransferase [Puniceibacterium sediminis]SNR49521.1 Acetyltransferase (GNAT) domain-containing protein [Puniceibacterium sediminis]
MPGDIQITAMSVEELETVLGWAGEAGWNPGMADAEAFHAADPMGFFLARVENTPVAAISVVNHGAKDAFLGLYICHPDWRGKGLGMAIWRHAIEHAGARSIGLDGVPEQEANYRISGFVRVGSTLRHEGRWPARTTPGICAPLPGDLATLIELDARANGVTRPVFLSAWLQPKGDLRGTRILRRDGGIIGFATWRACREGTKIGPIIAPDTASALDLIADIADLRPNGPLVIDLPSSNAALRSALEGAGFQVPFATARMYRGCPPSVGPSLQAIATMELG